jgi:hypothetical protein
MHLPCVKMITDVNTSQPTLNQPTQHMHWWQHLAQAHKHDALLIDSSCMTVI